MVWIILGVIFIVLILATISYSGVKQVAWMEKMRRVTTVDNTEWIAPDYVLQQVRNDYLMALRWQRESMFHTPANQLIVAPYHLTGQSLQRYQKLLNLYRTDGTPRYLDALNADHNIEVRNFSNDGERCYIIDRQTHRSMTTYDYGTHALFMTQAIEDAALVYTMLYDKHSRRWKIESFVQQLPAGWRKNARHVKFLSASGRTIGRDN